MGWAIGIEWESGSKRLRGGSKAEDGDRQRNRECWFFAGMSFFRVVIQNWIDGHVRHSQMCYLGW